MAVSCNTGFFMYSCEAKIKLAAVALSWWSAKSKQDRVPFSCSRQQTGLLGDSLDDRRGTFEIVRWRYASGSKEGTLKFSELTRLTYILDVSGANLDCRMICPPKNSVLVASTGRFLSETSVTVRQ